MKEIIEKYKGVKWGGGEWSHIVSSNDELNEIFFFQLLRNDMGGNLGIHKINENDT